MNLIELQAEVILLTARPDLTDLTRSAIQAATLKAHRFDYFPKDLWLGSLNLGGTFTEALLSTEGATAVLPRFRTLKYVRKFENVSGVHGEFFTVIDPININDEYGVQQDNIAYLGGSQLVLKSRTAFSYVYIAYYTDPVIAVSLYNSWVANTNPWAIIFEAAATIFRSIGQFDKFRILRDQASEELKILQTTSILAVGY
jgi:hypothetical protein